MHITLFYFNRPIKTSKDRLLFIGIMDFQFPWKICSRLTAKSSAHNMGYLIFQSVFYFAISLDLFLLQEETICFVCGSQIPTGKSTIRCWTKVFHTRRNCSKASQKHTPSHHGQPTTTSRLNISRAPLVCPNMLGFGATAFELWHKPHMA